MTPARPAQPPQETLHPPRPDSTTAASFAKHTRRIRHSSTSSQNPTNVRNRFMCLHFRVEVLKAIATHLLNQICFRLVDHILSRRLHFVRGCKPRTFPTIQPAHSQEELCFRPLRKAQKRQIPLPGNGYSQHIIYPR